MGVQISLGHPTSHSFGHIPESRIAGPYGNFIFTCLRDCRTVFHSSCSILPGPVRQASPEEGAPLQVEPWRRRGSSLGTGGDSLGCMWSEAPGSRADTSLPAQPPTEAPRAQVRHCRWAGSAVLHGCQAVPGVSVGQGFGGGGGYWTFACCHLSSPETLPSSPGVRPGGLVPCGELDPTGCLILRVLLP